MAHKATVLRWTFKGFGYVKTDDGKLVFVHHSLLPEGKALSKGGQVRVNYEDQGHNGKMTGTKCVGQGICSFDDFKVAIKEWQKEHKGGKKAPKGGRGAGGRGVANQPEKRKDSADGKFYPRSSFIEVYGKKG
eukprot:gene14963-2178_t